MKKNNMAQLAQSCDIMNRVFAAKLINDLYEKEGVKFHEYMPKASHINVYNKDKWYFTEFDQIEGLKCFYHGLIRLDNFDLSELENKELRDFLNDEMLNQIQQVAHEFANALKSQKHCDVVFSSLPDGLPYIYSCIYDPETNFRSRLISATDFASNQKQGRWEFYALIIEKLREVEPHVIYGKTYKSVDKMTDDEKHKFFNKESESNESKES